jgi:hypothetical protein
MVMTPAGLQIYLDRALANTGVIGYFCLIDDELLLNAAAVGNSGTNTITTTNPHGLVTGTRIRVATTGGTVPAPLSPTTDYFAAVVSATELKICATLANAIAGTEIDLASNGSNLQINEQILLPSDPKEVILAHEITGNGYTRQQAAALGAATIVQATGKALKSPVTWAQPATGGDIVYRHLAFLDGGNSTIGNTAGVLSHLLTLATPKTIADGANALLSFQFGHEN